MDSAITTVVNQARHLTAAALFLAAILAAGQSARAGASVTQEGDVLNIMGTRANDIVWIIGVDGHAGIVTVQVNNQPMVAYFGVTDINADLKGGNNSLALLQVNLGGNVSIAAENGANYMVLGYHKYMPNLIQGDLFLTLGDGYNQVLLEESWIISNATILSGDGGSNIVVGQADSPSDLGAVVLGNLTIETGAGDDLIEVAKSWLYSQAEFDTGAGSDAVILGTNYDPGSAIAGNVFNGDLIVSTGAGDDGVGLTDNQVNGDAAITMGQDDDELLIGDGAAFPPNDFYGAFDAHGGSGLDTLNDDPANFYAVPPVFQSFELP